MRHLKLQPRRRHIAASIALALVTAFISGAVIAVSLMGDAMFGFVERDLSGLDATVSPNYTTQAEPEPLVLEDVARVDGVQEAWWAPETIFTSFAPAGTTIEPEALSSDNTFAGFTLDRPTLEHRMLEGTRPVEASDIMVSDALARELNVRPHDSLSLLSPFTGNTLSLTVTGIYEPDLAAAFNPHGSAVLSQQALQVLYDSPSAAGEQGYNERIGISAEPGVSETHVRDALIEAGFEATDVTTLKQDANALLVSSVAAVSTLLTGFIAIALATSALVISNSFAVTMAQRRRSFALARALGATKGQAMGAVIRDALLVGVIGTFIGIVTAFAGFTVLLQIGRAQWSTALPPHPGFNLLAIIIPTIAGLVLALAASIAPAITATRVTPLEALRPIEATQGARASTLRSALGLIIVAGSLLITAGALLRSLTTDNTDGWAVGIAILGGLGVMLGVVIVLPMLIVPLMRLASHVFTRFGWVTGRFAALNAARHPKRTATTVSALVIGTTLMTLMATGAATGERTLVEELKNARPVDIAITAEQLPSNMQQQVEAVPGITQASNTITLDIPPADPGVGIDMTVWALTPDQAQQFVHAGSVAPLLTQDVIITGEERARAFGFEDGSTIELPGVDGSTRTVTIVVSGTLTMSFASNDTLEQLDLKKNAALLANVAPTSDSRRENRGAEEITVDILKLSEREETNSVAIFPFNEREAYGRMVEGMLISTVVLLAVAVIVALVGVANTLALSVVERSGENALLRAIGTSRRQIQSMLAFEGVLIATVGAALGLIIGVSFGLIGVRTLLPSEIPFAVGIPWAHLAGVSALAILAGLLASIVPGITASRSEPAAALASRDE